MSLRGFVDLSHSTACALSGAQEEAARGLWVVLRLRVDIVVFMVCSSLARLCLFVIGLLPDLPIRTNALGRRDGS